MTRPIWASPLDRLNRQPEVSSPRLGGCAREVPILQLPGVVEHVPGTTSDQKLSGAAASVESSVTSPASTPLAIVGASCGRSDVVGLLDQSGGTWQLDPVNLPGSLRWGRATVLTIGQTASGLTSVLEVTDINHTALLAPWTTSGGGWTYSPALSLAPDDHVVSIGPANGIGPFALTASPSGTNRLAVVNGPAAVWNQMPPPPPNTAMVAFGTGGSSAVDALTAHGTTMTVWSLDAGSGEWTKGQVLPVKLEFGSSS